MHGANGLRRRWLSAKEVAYVLGVTAETARALMARHRVPCIRSGARLIRYDADAIDALAKPDEARS